MRRIIFIAAMITAVLSLPLDISAKGKPTTNSVVLLEDANGVEIGRVIGMETASWPYVLTEQGYRTLFKVGTGMIYTDAIVFYESNDCTGSAYVGKRFPGTVFMPTLQDSIAYAKGALLYSPNDAESVILNTGSMIDPDLNCIPYVSNREVFPAYPNDPNVTGIKNTAYPNRMVIK